MSLTKSYVTPQEIEQARQLDLLSYLQQHEPEELVRFSSHVYTLRSHDSLKISNGKWYQWSTGIGGVSALDYLIKVQGMDFVSAVSKILRYSLLAIQGTAVVAEITQAELCYLHEFKLGIGVTAIINCKDKCFAIIVEIVSLPVSIKKTHYVYPDVSTNKATIEVNRLHLALHSRLPQAMAINLNIKRPQHTVF